MFKIEFKTSGAAFYDEYADPITNKAYTKTEIIRILNRIMEDMLDEQTYGSIMDINGNKIGEWSLD